MVERARIVVDIGDGSWVDFADMFCYLGTDGSAEAAVSATRDGTNSDS